MALSNKEILESSVELAKILTSPDRHDLSNFLHSLSDDSNNGLLGEKDFELFQSGFVLKTILELRSPETQKKLGLDPQSVVLSDRINYLTFVPDIQSLNNIFTNQVLIDGVINNDQDLFCWFDNSLVSLPLETRGKLATRFVELNKNDIALAVLNSMRKTFEAERDNENPISANKITIDRTANDYQYLSSLTISGCEESLPLETKNNIAMRLVETNKNDMALAVLSSMNKTFEAKRAMERPSVR